MRRRKCLRRYTLRKMVVRLLSVIKTMLVVGPVKRAVQKQVGKWLKGTSIERAVTITASTITEVIKNLPKDTMFKGLLEHCVVKANRNSKLKVDIEMSDGKRARTIVGKTFNRDYIKYKNILGKALSDGPANRKVVLNRKRLMLLLTAMDKICPDGTGDSPLYLTFTKDNDVVLRGENPVTDQRCIAVMKSYEHAEVNWLPLDGWEQQFEDNEWADEMKDYGDEINALPKKPVKKKKLKKVLKKVTIKKKLKKVV